MYRPLGLVEPQKLRQQQQEQNPQLDAPQLTAQHGLAATAPVSLGKVGVFDPSCPVSVAMAKLRALIGDSPEVNSAELPAHAQPVSVPNPSTGSGSASTSNGIAALRPAAPGMGALVELVGAEELEDVEEEEVPLECLRFFKLLNRRARR